MTKRGAALLRTVTVLFAGSVAWGQSGNPGQANFLEYAQSSFDTFLNSPTSAMQQWFRSNIAAMVVWSPYFDSRTAWYPNAYAYQDLYAVYKGSWLQYNHPEWILKDQYGNWLYIPFACSGGTCPEYAADVANPAYRSWWISQAQSTIARGNYPGLFIDDVNMQFNVSDGNSNLVAPIDSNTGQPMTYTAWRSYIASFMQQVRSALPNTKLMENVIWFAGPSPAYDSDPYIQAQLATADTLNLERGVASDAGLTGGTGFWSVYSFLNYVDRLHAMGKNIDFEQYQLDATSLQYGLASYFLISTGKDFVSDQTSNPNNWWSGYDVNLGTPLGPRTYNNGIFQRNFSNGIVLLAEPGLGTRTIQLPAYFQNRSGASVNSVTLSSRQGAILIGSATTTPTAPTPSTPPSTVSGVTRYLSDIPPNYSVNGYGPVQIDKSTGGTPLSIDGVTYAHGLGVNAYSEQHWALWGNCTSFAATVGVDSVVPSSLAHIDFQVWADGRLLYDSGYMHGWSPAGTVNVNLTGYQTLGLVVTNGIWMAPSWTTYNDNGDWANPIIVCNN